MSTEAAYPKTPVGEFDIKELPERVAFESRVAGDPEDARGDLFRANFRFLKENDLDMTTPVERDMTTSRPAMRFYVPRAREDEPLTPTPGVEVVRTAERLVASLGMRGGYSRRRFAEGEHRLREWLLAHPEWVAAGEPYGVYWNGPMVPAPLRRMEVHIPVRRA